MSASQTFGAPKLRHIAEVESLIGEAVERVVTKFPEWLSQRIVLINKLIEALETNASWVSLFGVTGELNVPDTDEPGEIFQPLHQVKEVGRY